MSLVLYGEEDKGTWVELASWNWNCNWALALGRWQLLVKRSTVQAQRQIKGGRPSYRREKGGAVLKTHTRRKKASVSILRHWLTE
jgi:hypothetical protein